MISSMLTVCIAEIIAENSGVEVVIQSMKNHAKIPELLENALVVLSRVAEHSNTCKQMPVLLPNQCNIPQGIASWWPT